MNARQPLTLSLSFFLACLFLTALGTPLAVQAASYKLTVTKTGTGSGTVASANSLINCGTTCSRDYASGTSVKLIATAASGSKFLNWSNGCTGTATSCTFTMNAARTVTANFARIVPLTVNKAGIGTVTSAPAGINCGATCTANYNLNTNVTLTATPGAGYSFTNWTNACTGTARTCTVAMSSAKATKATFSPIPVALTVTKAGTGVGTVTSTPAGINCGAACTANFNMNSSVTLTAAASAGSKFDGWTGACTGAANTCTIAMTAAMNATATFSPIPMGLTVNMAGTGKGKITSSPAGIDCGTACAVSFDINSSVTLTAAPDPGSRFDGWGEVCTGTAATCTVTMDAAKAVSASFSAIPAALSVTKVGAGKGTVTSNVGGIDCGSACAAGYHQLDTVTLTATPDEGSAFVRWLGACAGAASNLSCTVTLNQDSTAIASFGPATATSSTTTYRYDPNGNLTQVDDALGNVRKTDYDSLGQAVRLLEPDAASPGSTEGEIDTVYDALGQVQEVIDPRNLSTRYQRDALGNLLSLTSPDSGTSTYTYDEAGNLKTKTDARGKLSSYSYDRENRLTQANYEDQAFTYAWDACANGAGRLCAIATAGNSLAFSYDPHGRVASQNQTTGGITLSLQHTYDSQGRRTQTTTPGGNVLSYTWLDGRVDSITLNNQPLIEQILYEPDGQVGGWSWGNGTVSDRFYDLNGRPVAISLGQDGQGLWPDIRSYTYDTAGHVAAISAGADPNLDVVYDYDGLGRLIDSLHGATNSFDYGYDLSGNRTSKITDGATTETNTLDPGSNRLQQRGNGTQTANYSYDPAGNLTGDGVFTYGYNAQGRKISATGAGISATYAYNGLGQRISKTVNGVTTLYAYDEQGRLTGEYNAAGQPIQETLWLGNLPIAVIKPAAQAPLVNVYYVHADHLGAPRKVTRPSDNKPVWTWEGEAFGNTPANEDPAGLGSFTYNLRFPGQVHDQETSLYYNYFRDYDPANGRYTTSDPIGLAGGINTYSYVGGNPVNAIDPLGLDYIFGQRMSSSNVVPNGGEGVTNINGFNDPIWAAVTLANYGSAAYGGYGLSRAIGGYLCEGLTSKGASEAFHYTFSKSVPDILKSGLRPNQFATTSGNLSPLQAHIDLALRPNRGLPDALLSIDLQGMRSAGFEIPQATQVGRSFGMPGGGIEMQFPYAIPSQFISVVPK